VLGDGARRVRPCVQRHTQPLKLSADKHSAKAIYCNMKFNINQVPDHRQRFTQLNVEGKRVLLGTHALGDSPYEANTAMTHSARSTKTQSMHLELISVVEHVFVTLSRISRRRFSYNHSLWRQFRRAALNTACVASHSRGVPGPPSR
jgi:hypothetical protein